MQRIHGPFHIVYFTVEGTRLVRVMHRNPNQSFAENAAQGQATTAQHWKYLLRSKGGVIAAADYLHGKEEKLTADS
jgi:hypothetical protein